MEKTKVLTPTAKLEVLLRSYTLEQLLRTGQIFDVKRAAPKFGYSEQHVRRLCADGDLDCIRRKGRDYYFLPEQIEAAFVHSPVKGTGK